MTIRDVTNSDASTPINGIRPIEQAPTVSERVTRIAIWVIVFVGTVLGNLFTLCIPTVLRLISHVQKKGIKEEIERERIAHVATALCRTLTGPDKWKIQKDEVRIDEEMPTLKNGDYFLNRVIDLRNQIVRLENARNKGTVVVGSLSAVYKQFKQLVSDPVFMAIFEHPEMADHSAVNFLKLLATKFRSANMEKVLIKHAQEQLGDIEGAYSIGKTGEALIAHRKKPSFKQNFFWAISHPFAWAHSMNSQWLHKKYDSTNSNSTYVIHQLDYPREEGETLKVQFIAGPTPFNDPVYERIFLKTGHELRFDIMDTSKSSENEWIQKMDQIAKNSDSHLEHVVWGFATKQGFLNPTEINPLIDEYETALLKHRSESSETGVSIPTTLLSNDQISKACAHSKDLLRDLKADLTSQAGRHAALVVVDTMMALGTMTRYLDQLKDVLTDASIDEDMRAIHIATACKQCYDRGPIYLAALMIFFRSLTNSGALTEDEFYQIAGLPLIRAPLNEGREQGFYKFAVYGEFAKMLGSNMAALSKHTQAYIQSL